MSLSSFISFFLFAHKVSCSNSSSNVYITGCINSKHCSLTSEHYVIVNIMLLHCAHYCFPFIVGERFERGIQDAVILESDEALVVVAQEEFDDVTQDGKKQLYVNSPMHAP